MSNPFVFPANLRGVRIHFTGIKGTGMAALSEICVSRGALITGSDVSERFYTDEILERIGIVAQPFDQKNISPNVDFVVHSSAYKTDKNIELITALSLGLPVVKYTDAIGFLSAASYSCGIAGVHGKTTVTALAGTLLRAAQLPVQVLAGSAVADFGGSSILDLGHKYFVAETCEYERHFMAFQPQKIVVTSVESDHQDFFPTYEAIRDAFIDYALLLPLNGSLIYCADDSGATEVAHAVHKKRTDIILIPYGDTADGPYKLNFGSIKNGKQEFSLAAFNSTKTDNLFSVRIPGKHTVRNCAGALALTSELYKTEHKKNVLPDFAALQHALNVFVGSKRRSEIIGEVNGILFIDDYGHHPTAVQTTLAGLKEFYPNRRLVVDFMAHTYSRTAALLEKFASAFTSADEVILHKIYASARETYNGTITGKTLYEKTAAQHFHVSYFEEVLDAKNYVCEHLQSGDVFVTMGAGDNWKLGTAVFEQLKGKFSQINKFGNEELVKK